jgi:hypothetical protein
VPWSDVVLHFVLPAWTVVAWVFGPGRRAASWRIVPYVLLYPAVWGVFTIWRGGVVGWYPYYFLDPRQVSGLPEMIVTCLIALAIFALVARSGGAEPVAHHGADGSGETVAGGCRRSDPPEVRAWASPRRRPAGLADDGLRIAVSELREGLGLGAADETHEHGPAGHRLEVQPGADRGVAAHDVPQVGVDVPERLVELHPHRLHVSRGEGRDRTPVRERQRRGELDRPVLQHAERDRHDHTIEGQRLPGAQAQAHPESS